MVYGEKARYTNGNQPIIARTVGPFRSCPYAYDFQPGGYCDYDEVILQDGHVWIGYDWKKQRDTIYQSEHGMVLHL